MTAALVLMAVKSLLIAAATLGLLRLAARRSAAARSAIAHLGLCALLMPPLAASVLPSLPVFLPDHPSLQVLQAPMAAMVAPVALEPATASPSADAGGRPAFGVNTFVLYAYLAPAVTLLLFLGAALLQLFRLRASARPVTDAAWLEALARARRRMDFTKSVDLLTGGAIFSPVSWGLIRPTILLNGEILAAHGQAEAIIAHELAHVIHHDWAKLILARVTTAMFWFNPLAWLLAREAHHLREEAADDAVLAAAIAGPDYAALLMDVARGQSRGLLPAVNSVAPGCGSLRRRVIRVLDESVVREVPGIWQVAAFTAATLVVAAPLAAVKIHPSSQVVAAVVQSARSAIVAAPAPPVNDPAPAEPAAIAPPAPAHPIPRPAAAAPALKPRVAAPPSIQVAAPDPAAEPAAAAPQAQVGLGQVAQMLRETLDTECAGGGGTPGASPNLIRTADLNRDGVPDLVFDRMNYECRGGSVGRGRYDTTLTIFLANPSGAVAEVHTGAFYGSWIEFARDGKASLIVADTADCAKTGAGGEPNTGWEWCGHRLTFNPPPDVSGAEPAADKITDR